jgi:hypothetical protein
MKELTNRGLKTHAVQFGLQNLHRHLLLHKQNRGDEDMDLNEEYIEGSETEEHIDGDAIEEEV